MAVRLRFVRFVKDRQLYLFPEAKILLMCYNIFSALKLGKKQECLQTKVDSGGGVYPQTGTYVRYSDTWDLPTWGRNNNKNKESRTQIILYNFFGSKCGYLWIHVPIPSVVFC